MTSQMILKSTPPSRSNPQPQLIMLPLCRLESCSRRQASCELQLLLGASTTQDPTSSPM